MKLISVDALDDAVYDMTRSMDLDYGQIANYIDGMQGVRAVVIPENATNGDVIQALFPKASVYEHGSTYSVNNEYKFNSTWWNTPYNEDQRDFEEENDYE